MIVTTHQIPPNLSTPVFMEAWEMWAQHRKEIKHPLTPMSAKMQLKKLAVWGEKRAIAAIEHSVEQGYQGLFEPRSQVASFSGAVDLGKPRGGGWL